MSSKGRTFDEVAGHDKTEGQMRKLCARARDEKAFDGGSTFYAPQPAVPAEEAGERFVAERFNFV